MKTRTDIINEIIARNKFESYLEIGLGNGNNFVSIACKNKVSVDPFEPKATHSITSDEFFANNKQQFDLIFIDGLHHADQVEKDIINAYDCLSAAGMVLIHDCKPLNEAMQQIPRDKKTIWTGDVWRCCVGLLKTYPKIKMSFIPEKYGLFAIWKCRYRIYKGFTDESMTYKEFIRQQIY